jgi:glycosyltransferase involved in cell wall biosynthesis
MLENRDIVITGLQPWNFSLGSNLANIAQTLSKKNRVLFVNYAFDRATCIRRRNDPKVKSFILKKRKRALQLEQAAENLWVFTPGTVLESINQIKQPLLFSWLNRINNRRFAKQIALAVRKLNFSDFILFTDSDFYRSLYLPDLIKPSLFVYYIRDNMVAADYYKIHGPRAESEIIRKADAVVTNSEYLAEYARKSSPRSHFVGQGCDLELFSKLNVKPLPPEIRELKKRFHAVVGYIGALKSTRIDIDLLIYLAVNMPQTGFLLVGPEDDLFLQNKQIHSLPNVIFTGSKPEKELPSWLNFFDVAINPQKVNAVTIGNYPRKIDEYLALGKPVVATRTPAMDYFQDKVYLAITYEDYTRLIALAISENRPELEDDRMRYAQSHSWDRNIEEIGRVLDQCRVPEPTLKDTHNKN